MRQGLLNRRAKIGLICNVSHACPMCVYEREMTAVWRCFHTRFKHCTILYYCHCCLNEHQIWHTSLEITSHCQNRVSINKTSLHSERQIEVQRAKQPFSANSFLRQKTFCLNFEKGKKNVAIFLTKYKSYKDCILTPTTGCPSKELGRL